MVIWDWGQKKKKNLISLENAFQMAIKKYAWFAILLNKLIAIKSQHLWNNGKQIDWVGQ